MNAVAAWLNQKGLVPKAIGALRDYDRHKAAGDLIADNNCK